MIMMFVVTGVLCGPFARNPQKGKRIPQVVPTAWRWIMKKLQENLVLSHKMPNFAAIQTGICDSQIVNFVTLQQKQV